MGIFQKKPGTEKAPMKKDKGPATPKKRHPLAPLPTKDPKRKKPRVGNTGVM